MHLVNRLLDRARKRLEGTGVGQLPLVRSGYEHAVALVDGTVEIRGCQFHPVVRGRRPVYVPTPHETALFDRWIKYAEASQVVVDVGAAVGLYAIMAGRYSDATVYAFEPSQRRFAVLERNVAENELEAQVHVSDVAIGDEPDTSVAIASKRPETAGQTTLDALALAPDLVKIDVDGHELRVLRGARDTLRTSQPVLFLEVHPVELPKFGGSVEGVEALLHELDYGHEVCHRGEVNQNWVCTPTD